MAKGSSPAWAAWNPRDCWACNGRVYHTAPKNEGAGTYMDDVSGEAFSWHTRCASGPPPLRVRVAKKRH